MSRKCEKRFAVPIDLSLMLLNARKESTDLLRICPHASLLEWYGMGAIPTGL